MSHSSLAAAFAAGVLVVTPNNRLARELAARHDASRRDAGARAWPAAQVLPWTLWLERLWQAALAAGAEAAPCALLDRETSRELWHGVVDADTRRLLNPRGAARRAAEAWSTFHAWRQPGEDVERVTLAALHEDAAVFMQWAQRYRSRVRALQALDGAELADALQRCAQPSWLAGCAAVTLYGFLDFTPQQRRLVARLRSAGMTITELPAASAVASSRRRTVCATSRDEIAQALTFARGRLESDPQARIAIVVADLDRRRSEVVALAEEVLCAEFLLAARSDAPRPYNVSLGEPLGGIPIVASALDLIALSCGSVDATTAARIVRSPYLPDAAAQWTARADAERDWVAHGQRQVDVADIVVALRRRDPPLAASIATLTPPWKARRLPRDWARAWAEWLAAFGWPGNATLQSGPWQAREAWSAALAQFASMGIVTGAMSGQAALETLRSLLGDTRSQPEAAPARVQILGVLEAAGLAFDCAWLAGFDAGRWPEPVAPNPFLPLSWQRARGVPRAHADTVLAHSRALTSALTAIAPEIVVSYVETIDDAPATVSPLFADWERMDRKERPRSARFAEAIGAATLERWTERAGPPPAPGTALPGGAALFESQSACPFQAYARYRLDTRAWSECPEGLSAAERGNVLHETLKAFWDGVGDHATLTALDADALSARIAAAVATGKAKLDPARWRALAPAVAHAEASRLDATLRAWIEDGERARPPFRVQSHEQRVDYATDGFSVRVRIDRIDELAAGGLAIIDYKSGRVVRPARWLADRPEGIQLAVYASALERTTSDPIRALVYAQVKAGELDVAGIAETPQLWPALGVTADPGGASGWQDVRARLRDAVSRLGAEISTGVATVAPRDPGRICRYCGLDPLCRIQMLDDRPSDPATGSPDE